MRSDKRYEAKGIDPATGKRKSYYSRNSQDEADLKARRSYGIQSDKSLTGYYRSAFIPAILSTSVNWRLQVEWAMNQIWKPDLGDKDIREITRADIQASINKANLRYAPKSVQNAYKVIHAVLELAEADEAIDRNPCIKIRLAAVGETDLIALSFAQLAQLIKHSHPLIKPFVLLAGSCSLRLGEACGTMLSDLDNKKPGEPAVLHVQRQILQVPGLCAPTPTLKTPQSDRLIPLPAALKDMLLGCGQVSDVWLCSDTIGGYIRPKNVARELTRACEAAGLGHYEEKERKGGRVKVFVPLVSNHELRHTFISLMENDLEVPGKVVEDLSGKANKRKTKGYSHTEMAQLEKAMGRYWERLSKELERGGDEILRQA